MVYFVLSGMLITNICCINGRNVTLFSGKDLQASVRLHCCTSDYLSLSFFIYFRLFCQ